MVQYWALGVNEGLQPRNPQVFDGRTLRRQFKWDRLDLLYFEGYAIWNYLTAPFLFASEGVTARQLDERRLALEFADSVPTHSRHQTVYADPEGRIGRLDYTAEIFGHWARAANRLLERRTVDGLVFGVHRRVTPRFGDRVLPAPTIVDIRIGEIEVTSRKAQPGSP